MILVLNPKCSAVPVVLGTKLKAGQQESLPFQRQRLPSLCLPGMGTREGGDVWEGAIFL